MLHNMGKIVLNLNITKNTRGYHTEKKTLQGISTFASTKKPTCRPQSDKKTILIDIIQQKVKIEFWFFNNTVDGCQWYSSALHTNLSHPLHQPMSPYSSITFPRQSSISLPFLVHFDFKLIFLPSVPRSNNLPILDLPF
jgi:hypothetical protein